MYHPPPPPHVCIMCNRPVWQFKLLGPPFMWKSEMLIHVLIGWKIFNSNTLRLNLRILVQLWRLTSFCDNFPTSQPAASPLSNSRPRTLVDPRRTLHGIQMYICCLSAQSFSFIQGSLVNTSEEEGPLQFLYAWDIHCMTSVGVLVQFLCLFCMRIWQRSWLHVCYINSNVKFKSRTSSLREQLAGIFIKLIRRQNFRKFL